jgi:hypothetical protein
LSTSAESELTWTAPLAARSCGADVGLISARTAGIASLNISFAARRLPAPPSAARPAAAGGAEMERPESRLALSRSCVALARGAGLPSRERGVASRTSRAALSSAAHGGGAQYRCTTDVHVASALPRAEVGSSGLRAGALEARGSIGTLGFGCGDTLYTEVWRPLAWIRSACFDHNT